MQLTQCNFCILKVMDSVNNQYIHIYIYTYIYIYILYNTLILYIIRFRIRVRIRIGGPYNHIQNHNQIIFTVFPHTQNIPEF